MIPKGITLFYFEPRRGSKFEVSAAASVVAKRCPLDTSYVSRFHIKRERLQKGITLFYFESCRGLVAKKEVQFERDYNAKRYPVSIRMNFFFLTILVCQSPDLFRSSYHVPQAGVCFFDTSGFQTTVRIYPEFIRLNLFKHSF